MNKVRWSICLLVLGATFSALADSSLQSSRTAYLDQATAGVGEISVQALNTMLENSGDGIVLLDVRTFYERNRTSVIDPDREMHIPRGFLEIKAWDALPRDREIVVYCSKGMRSKLAAKTLQDMGWSQVKSLDGGIQAWYELQGETCGCLPENQEIPVQLSAPEGECTN